VTAILPDDETTEAEGDFDPDAAVDPDPEPFTEPDYDSPESQHALALYRGVDPDHVVPKVLLEKALQYYDANLALIKNKEYLGVIDFSMHSSAARFYIIRMDAGSVRALHVAHGSGSDRDNNGYAESFSDIPGSHMSSLGFYKVSEVYQGEGGARARMDGLSPTNYNARIRAIVIHGAPYVHESNERPGRSWGCFALAQEVKDPVIDQFHGGAIIYAGLSGN
jgi:hypothetical protein